MIKHLPALILCAACSSTPTAKSTSVDALTVASNAVVVTDAALAVAIAAQPKGADMSKFDVYVGWLEGLSDAIESKGDICGRLPMLAIIAESIKCASCATMIGSAEGALECKR
jgi:hypothetical protein